MENTLSRLEADENILELDTSEMEGKYLTFWTDKQLYGIPISNVVQIVQFQEITQIPESLEYMLGIINLRGSIIPVIDVRKRFGKEEQEYTERSCIIVTNIRSHSIGFIVDGVNEVTDIDDKDISEPPSVSKATHNAFITGIGKKQKTVTLLLDMNKLLNDEEVVYLTEQAVN